MKLNNFSNSKFIWIVMVSVLLVSLSGFSQNVDAEMKSKLITKNLQTDKVITNAFWNISSTDSLDINFLNADVLTADQYDAVVHVITSMETVELSDVYLENGKSDVSSTYYLGWAGALTEAQNDNSTITIPSKFNIVESSTEGDIVINFSNELDPNGFTGYTKSIFQDNEIILSYITIYDLDNLSISDLTTIVRHEFGHSLGMGHSNDYNDLMAEHIVTPIPYISECNVHKIHILYGSTESIKPECV